MPSDVLIGLAVRVVDGGALSDSDFDVAFDEVGVSTEAQLAALALARGWVEHPRLELTEHDLGLGALAPVTGIQRAYLEAVDRWLRAGAADGRELAARVCALEWVWFEARDRRARGEFPELDEDFDVVE